MTVEQLAGKANDFAMEILEALAFASMTSYEAAATISAFVYIASLFNEQGGIEKAILNKLWTGTKVALDTMSRARMSFATEIKNDVKMMAAHSVAPAILLSLFKERHAEVMLLCMVMEGCSNASVALIPIIRAFYAWLSSCLMSTYIARIKNIPWTPETSTQKDQHLSTLLDDPNAKFTLMPSIRVRHFIYLTYLHLCVKIYASESGRNDILGYLDDLYVDNAKADFREVGSTRVEIHGQYVFLTAAQVNYLKLCKDRVFIYREDDVKRQSEIAELFYYCAYMALFIVPYHTFSADPSMAVTACQTQMMTMLAIMPHFISNMPGRSASNVARMRNLPTTNCFQANGYDPLLTGCFQSNEDLNREKKPSSEKSVKDFNEWFNRRKVAILEKFMTASAYRRFDDLRKHIEAELTRSNMEINPENFVDKYVSVNINTLPDIGISGASLMSDKLQTISVKLDGTQININDVTTGNWNGMIMGMLNQRAFFQTHGSFLTPTFQWPPIMPKFEYTENGIVCPKADLRFMDQSVYKLLQIQEPEVYTWFLQWPYRRRWQVIMFAVLLSFFRISMADMRTFLDEECYKRGILDYDEVIEAFPHRTFFGETFAPGFITLDIPANIKEGLEEGWSLPILQSFQPLRHIGILLFEFYGEQLMLPFPPSIVAIVTDNYMANLLKTFKSNEEFNSKINPQITSDDLDHPNAELFFSRQEAIKNAKSQEEGSDPANNDWIDAVVARYSYY